jgi:hypothetical protein
MCKATEHFITRFPEDPKSKDAWRLPTLDSGGHFLNDQANLRPEANS